MKKLLLITITSLFSLALQAQWTVIGDSISTNNKVGIGIAEPTTNLHIYPQGSGGILIGHPNRSSGGYTSLSMGLSAEKGGNASIQSIQSSGSVWGGLALNPLGGNVGIGTLNPDARLTVNGNINAKGAVRWGSTGAILGGDQGASIELRGTGVPYFDFSNDPTTDYDMRFILLNDDELHVRGGDLVLGNKMRTAQGIQWGNTGAILGTDQGASIELRGSGIPFFDFSNDPTTDYDMRLILVNDNTLAVYGGTLVVDGKFISKEVKVQSNVWADFVFDKDYNLPTLEEVEKHIQEKGHLKNIPSEKEVEENGILLGEMNAKLLQKIEELTLYTIQQQKEIETLKNENKALRFLSERLSSVEEKLGQ